MVFGWNMSCLLFGSFVVIGFTAEDGECAIDLLHEEETHHLVGEGHAREGEFLVGEGIDVGCESVGSSDDEDQSACR